MEAVGKQSVLVSGPPEVHLNVSPAEETEIELVVVGKMSFHFLILLSFLDLNKILALDNIEKENTKVKVKKNKSSFSNL